MDDITIIFKATFKVIKYFFPAVVFIVFGLAYIAYDERRDKYGQRVQRN